MAELFGLRPWDIDRLTYWQWMRYRSHVDERIKAQQQRR